ncbi:DUF3006 domain-containing protein [Salinibaculum salinum]|uniref:DUF3006 domain-containing protein n=1 Tax=Salinibaculum salinum TaxID=3131996 RepID=UPI0030EDDB34
MNGTYTAVIDRIVDGETAVVLLESDDEIVDQFDIGVELVPPDGQHEGAVFEITVDDDRVEMRYQPEIEADRREAAQDRFDRLSKRLGDEDE